MTLRLLRSRSQTLADLRRRPLVALPAETEVVFLRGYSSTSGPCFRSAVRQAR